MDILAYTTIISFMSESKFVCLLLLELEPGLFEFYDQSNSPDKMICVLFSTSGSKFGLFLGTDLCQSQEFWYNDKSDEYSGSKDCQIGMGAYMSISSIVAYFISMVLAVGYASRPKAGAYNYEDEDSLPSWMASEAEGISATQKAVAQELVVKQR